MLGSFWGVSGAQAPIKSRAAARPSDARAGLDDFIEGLLPFDILLVHRLCHRNSSVTSNTYRARAALKAACGGKVVA